MRFKRNLVCVVVVDVGVVPGMLGQLGVPGMDRLGGVGGVAGQTVATGGLHLRRGSHVETALSLTRLEQLLAGVVVVVDITLV